MRFTIKVKLALSFGLVILLLLGFVGATWVLVREVLGEDGKADG